MSEKTKLELLAAEWHELRAKIEGHENALKEHLKSDWLETKDRYETAIAHFKERLEGVTSKLPTVTLLHLQNGASASHAIECHLNPRDTEVKNIPAA